MHIINNVRNRNPRNIENFESLLVSSNELNSLVSDKAKCKQAKADS